MTGKPADKKLNYLLRDIPPRLWKKARHVAVEEDLTLRELLLKSLEEHCEGNNQQQKGKAMKTVPTKAELMRKFVKFVEETDLIDVAKGLVDIGWAYSAEEYELWPLRACAPNELAFRGEIVFDGDGGGDLLERNEDGEPIVADEDLAAVQALLFSRAEEICEQLQAALAEKK